MCFLLGDHLQRVSNTHRKNSSVKDGPESINYRAKADLFNGNCHDPAQNRADGKLDDSRANGIRTGGNMTHHQYVKSPEDGTYEDKIIPEIDGEIFLYTQKIKTRQCQDNTDPYHTPVFLSEKEAGHRNNDHV